MSTNQRSHDLPLSLCRQHRFPHQIEYSFKLESGRLPLVDRYVVGVSAQEISAGQLRAVTQDLGMPFSSTVGEPQLETLRQQATTIYFGHEEHPSGSSLRLYFEFWDQVCKRLKQVPQHELAQWRHADAPLWMMMVGYKWPSLTCAESRQTDYWVRPLLTSAQIHEKVIGYTSGAASPSVFSGIMSHLVMDVIGVSPQQLPVFLDVRDSAGKRQSFDLCCHRYGVKLNAHRGSIESLIQLLTGSHLPLEHCLNGHSPESWLTHISAGLNHQGHAFATFYYDPSPD